MGHFDPESVNPEPKPNYEDGTVDINWNLKQKSNDQIQMSFRLGTDGCSATIRFKTEQLLYSKSAEKNKDHKGFLPIGDGETMSLKCSN